MLADGLLVGRFHGRAVAALGGLGRVAGVPELFLLGLVEVLILVLKFAQGDAQLVEVVGLLLLHVLLDDLLDLLLVLLLLPAVDLIDDQLLELGCDAA